MAKKKNEEVDAIIETSKEITSEQFLNSKGINPPIKEAPLHGLTFVQLCELMTEFKNA